MSPVSFSLFPAVARASVSMQMAPTGWPHLSYALAGLDDHFGAFAAGVALNKGRMQLEAVEQRGGSVFLFRDFIRKRNPS